jgi:hypothetical protein
MKYEELNIIENFLSPDECKYYIDGIINNSKLDTDLISNRLKTILNDQYKLKGHRFKELNKLKPKKYTNNLKYPLEWNTDKDSYFTIAIQLNNDYENGYIQFLRDDDEKYLQVPRNSGSAIIFFSNIKNRQARVREGIRFTIETKIGIEKDPNDSKTLI